MGEYLFCKINLDLHDTCIYVDNHINIPTSCMVTPMTLNHLMHENHNHKNTCITNVETLACLHDKHIPPIQSMC